MLELNPISNSQQFNQSNQFEKKRLEKLTTEEILRKEPFIAGVVYNTLTEKGNRIDMTDELANKALFQALKSVAQFRGDRGEGSLKAWLAEIARNTVYGFFRDIKNEPSESKSRIPIEDLYFDPVDKKLNPQESMIKQEQDRIQKKAIEEAMKKLEDRNRQALELFYVKNMDYKEIAKEMGLTIQNVKTIMHRARKDLAGYMGQHNLRINKKNRK